MISASLSDDVDRTGPTHSLASGAGPAHKPKYPLRRVASPPSRRIHPYGVPTT